jgi:hypothetical protein
VRVVEDDERDDKQGEYLRRTVVAVQIPDRDEKELAANRFC